MKNVSNILAGFFDRKCNVFECSPFTDEAGITQFKQNQVLSNIPCRICYKDISSSIKGKISDYVTQKIILMVMPDVQISDGSIVEVFKNGEKSVYKKMGRAAVYDNHKEFEMILREYS